MDWHEHIHSDPGIGFGKPIFRGTRIKVEFLLKLIAAGWSTEKIIEEYTGIEEVHLRAAAAFAADLMDGESFAAVAQAKAA
jgi:uncharacterized protein (DUF433 family)